MSLATRFVRLAHQASPTTAPAAGTVAALAVAGLAIQITVLGAIMGNLFGSGGGGGGKIQHTVLFKFPELARGSDGEKTLDGIVAQFNALPGIAAGFSRHGSATLDKAAFLESVDWPDKTDGYTHCLLVVADDAAALKGYLHSDAHLKAWMGAVKPYIKGIVVFDSKLAVDLDPAAADLVHPVLFRLKASADGAAMRAHVAEKFNAIDGVAASVEPFLGAAFLESVDWPDKAGGFTWCLTVTARDAAALKTYLHSEAHAAWVPVVKDHMDATLGPPTLVFDAPLTVKAAP